MKIIRKVVSVGNSKGVIIPSEWLESRPNLEQVVLDMQDGKIVITEYKEVYEDVKPTIATGDSGFQN